MLYLCQANNQFFNSPTPSECPAIQFNFDTSYPKLVQTPYKDPGFSPTGGPQLQTPAASGVPRLPVLLFS